MLTALMPAGARDAWAAYARAYKSYNNPLSPEECEKLLDRFHINNDRTKQLLEDYRY